MDFVSGFDAILPKTTFGVVLLIAVIILTYFQFKRKNLKDTVDELQDLVETMKSQQDQDRQRHIDDKTYYEEQHIKNEEKIHELQDTVNSLKQEITRLEVRAVSAEKEVEMLREVTAPKAFEQILVNQEELKKERAQDKKITEKFHNSLLEVLQKFQEQSAPE